MTDKQPEALRLADWLEPRAESIEHINTAALLRTQHAAIERKDALLRQALGALREYAEYDHCVLLSDAITKELQ